MTILYGFFGAIILSICFGRNSLGNVFGSSIGIGMLSRKVCATLMGMFILLGALFGGNHISDSIQSYLHFIFPIQVLIFSLLVALVIFLLTSFGIPISIAQISMGGLLGWNLAYGFPLVIGDVVHLFTAWIFSPILSCLMAFILFKFFRSYLKKHPVPLLHRDIWVRINMICIGCFISYMLGANNVAVIYTPLFQVLPIHFEMTILLVCIGVFIGCLMASSKVIHTLSHELFPLSSMEAMIMLLSAAIILGMFSVSWGFWRALPISSSAALIGAIVGISCAKGGQGLNLKRLRQIIMSWFLGPCFSGLICFVVMLIVHKWGMM